MQDIMSSDDREVVPDVRKFVVLRHTVAVVVQRAKVELALCVILYCTAPEPSGRLCVVPCDSLSAHVQVPKIVLCPGIASGCGIAACPRNLHGLSLQ